MVGDAANLPPQERVLSPFLISRSVGVKLTRVIGADHRMTASGGVFNEGWARLEDRGTDVTARVTGLAWAPSDTTRSVHLGVAFRRAA